MPVIRFTDLSISKLKANKQQRFLDSALPGFGILVGKRRQTFFVVTDSKRRTFRTLGQYPAISLQEARRSALAIIDGTERIHAAQSPVDRITEYVRQLNAVPRWKQEQERILKRHLLPKTTNLATVTKKDILSITDALRHVPSEQLHCHRSFKAFFNWCAQRDYIPASPIQDLPPPTSQKSRHRVLTDDELKRIWSTSKLFGEFGKVIRLCILTGQRKGQIVLANTDWIKDNVITWPPAAMKAKREHLLPLTPNALASFHSLEVNFTAWGKPFARLKAESKVHSFTIHDLRRDFATRAASIGIEPHIIQRILAHSPGSIAGVTAIYDRYHYLHPIRSALEKYEAHLAAILGESLSS